MADEKKINLIYIAGNSFSGSTLLSYLLGSNIHIENLGELKVFYKKEGKICTCGEYKDTCPFWSQFNNTKYNLLPDLTLPKKYSFILRTVLGLKVSRANNSDFDDYKLMLALYDAKLKMNPQTKYLLDSSKSMWRLNQLLQYENLNIKVVYIKRGIKENISSMLKTNNFSFFRAIYTYKIKHYLINRFIKNQKLDVISVQHEDVCNNAQRELNRLGEFFNLSYDNYENNLKDRITHVKSGNARTNKQISEGFEGVKNEVKVLPNLSKMQQKILDFID